jgi:hypothetical protein
LAATSIYNNYAALPVLFLHRFKECAAPLFRRSELPQSYRWESPLTTTLLLDATAHFNNPVVRFIPLTFDHFCNGQDGEANIGELTALIGIEDLESTL